MNNGNVNKPRIGIQIWFWRWRLDFGMFPRPENHVETAPIYDPVRSFGVSISMYWSITLVVLNEPF